MYKLMILIEPQDDWTSIDEAWPQFLHHAENMPGLLREVTCRVDDVLYGDSSYALIHELHFENQDAARKAMASPEGRMAGKILQALTNGRMTLLLADHKEDELENIRKFKSPIKKDTDVDIR